MGALHPPLSTSASPLEDDELERFRSPLSFDDDGSEMCPPPLSFNVGELKRCLPPLNFNFFFSEGCSSSGFNGYGSERCLYKLNFLMMISKRGALLNSISTVTK